MVIVVVFAFIFSGCAGEDDTLKQESVDEKANDRFGDDGSVGDDRIHIVTSILPQETFVKAVGGKRVNVESLIPPGASPATYSPQPSDMKSVEQADIYFRIGYIPFE